MIWTAAVVLVVAWLVAMFSSFTLGGFIHVLPLIALILVFLGRAKKPPPSVYARWRPFAERQRAGR